MPILYNKYPTNSQPEHIYKNIEDISEDKGFGKIRLKSASGTTRCLGSALDAGKVCGYDYRPVLGKSFKTAARVLGDDDNVVDAWDMLNASKNTEDIDIIYDRERDGPITDDMLANIPLYAFIGTGDARGRYISKKNQKRISRHGIINLGFLEDGSPIIYDLGKFKKGIPDKYKGEINYIAVPKGGSMNTFKQLAGIRADAPTLLQSKASPTEVPTEPVQRMPDLPTYTPIFQEAPSRTQEWLGILKRALASNFRNATI